jgi:effector-binding domain-containing protein
MVEWLPPAAEETSMTTFTVETIEPQPAAVIRAEVPMAELREVFDRGFPAVMRVVEAQGIAITGPPFGFYPRMPGDTVAVAVGFPVAEPITADGEVEPFQLPGGRAVTGTHVGPYEALGQTYEQLMAWTEADGLTLLEGMWESYVSDPSAEPDPSTWRTLVVWPLA